MIIKATQGHKLVRFTWSDDGQDCNYVALGVPDEEIDMLIDAKVHEGVDFEGWTVDIEL